MENSLTLKGYMGKGLSPGSLTDPHTHSPHRYLRWCSQPPCKGWHRMFPRVGKSHFILIVQRQWEWSLDLVNELRSHDRVRLSLKSPRALASQVGCFPKSQISPPGNNLEKQTIKNGTESCKYRCCRFYWDEGTEEEIQSPPNLNWFVLLCWSPGRQ